MEGPHDRRRLARVFDSFAPQYMNEVFTTDSVREAAFLVELLELPRWASILDIGCGTGRHAVELVLRRPPA